MGLAVLLLLVAADAPAPQALRTASANIFLIREGEVVEEGLYVAGSIVRVAGTIEGDLIVLASDHLDVTGRVEGDVIGFATTATIGGVVEGSVRLVGVDLEIAAEVKGDAVALGRDIRTGGSIIGDLLVWSRSLFAGGEVGHDMGGRTFGLTTIAGTVGRDVEMTVARMRVLDGARVSEDLGYRSANEATIQPGSFVGGTTVRRLPLTPDLRFRAAMLMAGFIAFVLFVAYGLLRIRFRPEQVERSVQYLARHPLKSFLHGLVELALRVAPVAVLFGGVVWGSPSLAVATALAALIVLPAVLLLMLWRLITAPLPVLITAGRRLGRNRLNNYGAFVVSAIVMVVLLPVPYVGITAGLGVVTLGTGAHGQRRQWRPVVRK